MPAVSVTVEVAPALQKRLVVNTAAAWTNVVLAALLMLATLPGRTQGLGLITEPMSRDLALDRATYATSISGRRCSVPRFACPLGG